MYRKLSLIADVLGFYSWEGVLVIALEQQSGCRRSGGSVPSLWIGHMRDCISLKQNNRRFMA